jgi:putative Holliday junction resolvase
MKILGLDYGERSIGVAVSDTLMMFASPLTVLKRKQNESVNRIIEELAVIVRDNNVTAVVLGLPKNMNNSIGERAAVTKRFGDKLKKSVKHRSYLPG